MSNKDKIMEAATELFHFYGYDGTSIDMLIKKAGVSKSNFYYYFEGKEELGLSVLTKLAEKQIREISEIMQTDLSPPEQFLDCYKRAFSSHRHLLEQSIYGGSFFGNIAIRTEFHQREIPFCSGELLSGTRNLDWGMFKKRDGTGVFSRGY